MRACLPYKKGTLLDLYDITTKDDHWQLIKQGADRSIKNSDTKAEAIAHMQEFMADKTASVRIHREDGTIEQERTYPRSADPRSSRG